MLQRTPKCNLRILAVAQHKFLNQNFENLFHGFYRATRIHSADYDVARCLSVRHTPVLSLNGYIYQSFFTVG